MNRFYPKRGSVKQWLEDHSTYSEDGCLTWPYAKNPEGRGQIRIAKKLHYAAALMCEIVNGPRPTDDHQVAHSCGNGHLACVHPGHLRWATPSENQMDRVIHGTSNRGERHGMARLTTDEVLALREAEGSYREIAARFGIAYETARLIKLRKIWGWL